VVLTIDTATMSTGCALSYAQQGDPSGPVVLLLPGPTDSWRSYEQVLARLPQSVCAIAVSPRGHGDSDKPLTGYRVEDFATDVVEFLDVLGIDRAVLAAHSGSCLVARRVAIDRGERVAGLVLEASPTTLRGNTALEEFVRSDVACLEDPIDPVFARSVVIDTSAEEIAPELADRLVDEVLKVPARVWREVFAGLLQYDDTAEVDRIIAPTLLVWGEADRLVGREMQTVLEARLRDAVLLVYPQVGHTPRWEEPGRFADDLVEFVARASGPRSEPG